MQGVVHGGHALDQSSPTGQVDAGRSDVGGAARAHQDDGRPADAPLKQGGASAIPFATEALHAPGHAPHHRQPQHERRRCAGEDELPAAVAVCALPAGGSIDQSQMALVRSGLTPLTSGDVDTGGDPAPGVVAFRPHAAQTRVLRNQADDRSGTAATAGGETGTRDEGVVAHLFMMRSRAPRASAPSTLGAQPPAAHAPVEPCKSPIGALYASSRPPTPASARQTMR